MKCNVCKKQKYRLIETGGGLDVCPSCYVAVKSDNFCEVVKSISKKYLLILFVILMPVVNANAELYLSEDNYYKNCEGVLSQSLIGSHTCNELITSDGHTLTDTGVTVFGCLGPTALQGIFGSDLTPAIQQAANGQCGGTYPGNSNGHHGFGGTNIPLVDLSGNNGDSIGKRIYCKIFC